MAVRRRRKTTERTVESVQAPTIDIESMIKNPNEVEIGGSYLLYGRSGTGKTTISTTFPGPILHLDFGEQTTDSLNGLDNVKTAFISNWDELDAFYWYLAEGEHEFQTVVIDTITAVQELALEKALTQNGKEEGDFPSKKDWGEAAGLLKRAIINFRDLSMPDGPLNHVVFLAQDRVTNIDDEAEEDQIDPSVGPALMPSVAKVLNAAVKVIGNTYIKEVIKKANNKAKRVVEYRLRLGPHAYYLTKIRTPKGYKVPSHLMDPSYKQIQSVMRGETKDGQETEE